jgi:hypothetical protein
LLPILWFNDNAEKAAELYLRDAQEIGNDQMSLGRSFGTLFIE